jgi:hypothetical protein
MTHEDQQQIATIVAAAVQQLTERQDRAVETIAGEISALRESLTARMTREFQAVHNRLERTNASLTALHGSITAINLWADRTDQIVTDHQRATDEAIAEMRQRIEALEKKAS